MSNFPDANFPALRYLPTLIKIDMYTCRNRPLSKFCAFQYFQKLPLHTRLYRVQYIIVCTVICIEMSSAAITAKML